MKLNQKKYRSHITTFLVAFTCLLLPVQKCLADHAQVLTSDIEFSCDQTEDNHAITCNYRLIDPEIIKKISATLGSTELPIQDIKTYPFEDSSTSILFLVDSSKSENPEQIQSQIIAFAQQALPHQHIGLATFDANLKIIKPLGSDPEEIIQASEEITETNQPTELYRNILDALELLKASQAERKALYIFSSGLSDDQAIYHHDVIKTAIDSQIKLISIGYPVSNNPIDTTLTLQRLSKDSGGIFIKASEGDFELPDVFLSDPFAAIDNGGFLSIDLSPVLSGDIHGIQLAMLILETNSKRITVKMPLELSSSNNSTTIEVDPEKDDSSIAIDNGEIKDDSPYKEVIVDKKEPVLNAEGKVEQKLIAKTTIAETTATPSLLIYWPIIPIILILLGLSIFSLSRNKKQEVTTPEEDDGKPMGWLISLADDTVFYSIDSSPCSIGRTRENNLFLEHSSVSRNHAEIKRNRDGSFTVQDLDSLNGVYVNNTKVSTGLIKNEDKVDIGDVRLKFVLERQES